MSAWDSRLFGAAYDLGVEREWLARPVARLLWGADVRPLYDTLRRLADLPVGTSLLDAPCGGGVALRGLRPGQGLRYVGADLSQAMLRRTRRRAQRAGLPADVVAADLARLPFADGGFDVCVTFNGLHCVPDPAGAVGELARCLAPGGRLVGDLIVRGAGRRQDAAIAALRRLGIFGEGGTVAELRAWCAAAGLRIEHLERSGAVVAFSAV
ncbi:ubiquinone biosynthesis protein [Actinophytocola xinjiangensis]|uniref:Ubiquinone biosynthesis protein n=1 Tax=Actinophytocola xinjiangensis TaxID=485602 RepID=A0A7Z1AX76_9PSEU|nr:methyltransferase domain-containing protein [Actinophytocola xinjiangensis]OLF08787.1 ubiquinone biosynthesis protein [Actinophytocola xinjiangensis]